MTWLFTHITGGGGGWVGCSFAAAAVTWPAVDAGLKERERERKAREKSEH